MTDRVATKYFLHKRIDGAGSPARNGWIVHRMFYNLV